MQHSFPLSIWSSNIIQADMLKFKYCTYVYTETENKMVYHKYCICYSTLASVYCFEEVRRWIRFFEKVKSVKL